jgi:hypothetical protein
MMRAVAQLDRKAKVDRSTRNTKDQRHLPRHPRPVRSNQNVSRKQRFVFLAKFD